VEQTLARHRAARLHDVEYRLHFDIPAWADSTVTGHADVSFTLEKPEEVVLDFYPAKGEHLVYPAEQMRAGRNTVHIDFEVNPRLLNHRGNLVYTLSVPDKSRRLFPCFDQPDVKATYQLTLTMPAHWLALSNGAVVNQQTVGDRKVVQFAPTEPISTYLFAFTAGELNRVEQTRDGRTVTLYHSETDSLLTAQCDDIFEETFAALRWQEEYTGIAYPFAKFDMALIPGFQFGGMEHTGATLYNDHMLFLSPQATINERLARTSIIAHETSHMWFGDYVTMNWFGEVWTKEVFANYYAAAISEPLYPEVDHALRFMLAYAPSAYDEDRTPGANPIQQELDNLQDAGLVYGNIIYNKSPIMMRQLVRKVGEETFRRGIHNYLAAHAYGNATWDDLVASLDSLTKSDLKAWSYTWLHEAGMPVYRVSRRGRTLTLRQDRLMCPQQVVFSVDGARVTADCDKAVTKVRVPKGAQAVLPNVDGLAYGYFAMDSTMWRAAWSRLREVDDVSRGALLINLYEAFQRGDVSTERYIERIAEYLPWEQNDLLFNLVAGQVRTAYTQRAKEPNPGLERVLKEMVLTDTVPTRKLTAMRTLMYVMDTPETVEWMRRLLQGELKVEGLLPGARDMMSLTYQLAVHLPERADSLVAWERSCLTNANLRREFDFIAPAVSPRQEVRDSVFAALLQVENRSVEPWAGSALALLNHRCRRAESAKYLRPGLEVLEEVKRTGDIFFPKLWVTYLLGGHDAETVRREVDAFLAEHADYPLMLKRKILMNVR
jgi:aminopeptidase N